MRALRGLVATDIQSRQLTLQWESLAFNLTRCHTYSVSLCYRYTTAGGGGGHNTTVRECLAVEHNASRFTLRDLPPYHAIHVRLSLTNPEGKKEGREVTFQTEEDSKCLGACWSKGSVGNLREVTTKWTYEINDCLSIRHPFQFCYNCDGQC